MDFASNANKIFDQAVADYHKTDSIDAPALRPYCGGVDAILYAKCWIDAAQWHMEDIIRVPDLDPAEAIKLKRRIDRSNQDRTDMVEDIDTYFRDLYRAIDRLLDDIAAGRKYMKVYRQMKLYNDPATNPELYKRR